MDGLQMTVAFSVKGKEGLNFTLNYENTTLETVVQVEMALLNAIAELLESQQ